MRIFLVLALCFSAAHAADGPLKIICFGDSIVEGKTPSGLQPGERWTEKLEALSEGKLMCINEGKGGRLSSAVIELGPALKRTPDAKMVLIALGTNDSRDYKPGSVGRVTINFLKMIEIVRTANSEMPIVLCAPYNIYTDAIKDKPTVQARVENLVQFGKAIEKLSHDKKTLFINFYDVIPKNSMIADGVHPDAAGHAAIADAAWKVLSENLKTK